jgi:hypothetical protein
MSNAGFGQGSKKETVYGGPAPTAQGTVYGGPAGGGTVYNGGPTETVYRPAPQPAAAGGKTVAPAPATKAGGLFFLIAGLSVVNTVLALAGANIALALGLGITRMFDYSLRHGAAVGPVIALNLVAVGIFLLIGVFARQGSSVAVLIGLLLYGADTVLLVMDGALLHVASLIVHGVFLVSIFSAYRAMRS